MFGSVDRDIADPTVNRTGGEHLPDLLTGDAGRRLAQPLSPVSPVQPFLGLPV